MLEMRARWPLMLVTALMALLGGCFNATDTLTITGSSTIAPLIADIAERHEARHGTRINVQSGGSGRGIQDVRAGLADIGMVSRELTGDELDAGIVPDVLAWDGIALITHRDNPVAGLSTDQVKRLFRGSTENWRALGGSDVPVTIINKAEGRATLAVFLNEFDLQHDDIKADMIAGENQQVILAVAGNPGAIGYVSIGTALDSEAAIRMPALDGVAPTIKSVAENRWPLKRPLNLITSGELSTPAKAFLDELGSEENRELIRAHHFIPAN